MKKLFAGLLCIAMLLTLAACGSNNGGAYVPPGTGNGENGMVTVYLLTEMYDDDHKITYTYDENGNALSGASYEGSEIMQTIKWTYDDNGNLKEQLVYDDEGDLTTQSVYTCNDQGQQISLRYLDGSGEEKWTSTFSYDENGNLTKREDSDGYTVINTYEDNRLIQSTTYWDGEEGSSFKCTYDDNGYMVKKTHYYEGEMSYYETYTLNEHGKPVEIVHCDADGEESSTRYLKYASVTVSAAQAKRLNKFQQELI